MVPEAHRYTTFPALHNLANPDVAASVRLVARRLVWLSVKRDVRQWSRFYLQCQRAEVHRRTKAALATVSESETRFHHVHFDLVRPLPPSHGYVGILTC